MAAANDTFNNPQSYGLYVGTTNVWDVNDIFAITNIDPKLQELLVRLYQNLNTMSVVLNLKDSAYYNTDEFVNGQTWFPNQATPVSTFDTSSAIFRQNYRQVVNFGPLPNAGTISQPHNITITAQTSFTRIYGAGSNQTGLLYTPLPNSDIKVLVNATQVVISTAVDYSAYTIVYIVLEYLQT